MSVKKFKIPLQNILILNNSEYYIIYLIKKKSFLLVYF